MTEPADAADLRAAWEAKRDGQAAQDYGAALEEAGRVSEAAEIYTQAMAEGYLNAYYHLAWLESERGDFERAAVLLTQYLDIEDDRDDFSLTVSGVLGHWLWYRLKRVDAEPHLRAGQDHWQDARADLADLLATTGRLPEAIEVLERGVALGEDSSFLPLANIHWERGNVAEAERLFRLGFALGDAHSAYNLHSLLLELYRNDEARQWLSLAAEGGDEVAIRRLAESE